MNRAITFHSKRRHSVFLLYVPLVFVVKYRRTALSEEVLSHLRLMFSETCDSLECSLAEFNGESNHVHLLVCYPPHISVAYLAHRLKGRASFVIRKHRHRSVCSKLWGPALWSPSYFACSCGGAPIDVIRRYIELQSSERRS